MKQLLQIATVLSLLSGCKDQTPPQQPANSAVLEKIQQADSTWDSRTGGDAFVGMHSHGKDLAVHAHQDISKQRRILKESIHLLPEKKQNYQNQLEERRKILESKGLLSRDSEPNK